MHRIYCDSNLYRLLKPNHPSFKEELVQTFEDLKNCLFFCFSDAHMDDLKVSKIKEKTDEDLFRIGTYCKDNYLSYDHGRSKRLLLCLATPFDAYYSKDYEAGERAILEPFDVDSLFEGLDGDPLIDTYKSLMKSYLNLPISLFTGGVDTSSFDEKTKEMYDKMLPGFSTAMSLGDLINTYMPYGAKLLKDETEFTDLRKFATSYITSDAFSYKKWGLDFDRNLKESVFQKTFLELLDSILIEQHKSDWYYKFTYAYSLLETFGIAQERTAQNKLKKFTFDSMHRDGSHAFFAAYCDYLVTDDKGLQVKAHILFNLFGIKTEIMSSQDFINRRSLWLANEETFPSFTKSFAHDVKHSFQVSDHTSIGSFRNMKEYKTGHPYFNYFNRYQLMTDDEEVYAFFCRRDKERNLFFYREVELLTEKMLKIFGVDDYNKGPFSLNEKDSLTDEFVIRSWTIIPMVFELSVTTIEAGNFIVLTAKVIESV